MTLIRAFRGLRPTHETAEAVVAPPYDVMDREEACAMVKGRPWSFLHISRPEVDLPSDVDPYSPEVYEKARENLEKQIESGILIQDERPCYYVYRLTMGTHVQVGLVCAASVDAYDRDRIKKHEHTQPHKEDDRVRQIEALQAHTGPVFLVYKADTGVDEILAEVTQNGVAELDVTAADGVRHEVWVVDDGEKVAELTRRFDAMDALYVADGHHRSASASRVSARHREANPRHTGEEDYNYFLSVLFPADQMQILPYNRLVTDLNGHDPRQLLGLIEEHFKVTHEQMPVLPCQPTQFGMYLSGQWYRLDLHRNDFPQDNPVARLDVSLLSHYLIEPILGIKDQRRDPRIAFVGGIRGLKALESRVDSGEMTLAFSLYPTSMEALMAVADADNVMPPKSTWFEPKLADGLVSHLID